MKVIPLGLQCSVPYGINQANMREYSYAFDWLWTPSKTSYNILNILLNDSIEKAVEYMTTGYTYYKYLGNEVYISTNKVTESQINKDTGLGITHFTINDEYKAKLKRRLERMIRDIRSDEEIILIYCDAASPQTSYILDGIEYGVDGTEYLLKIHELLYPINNKIKVVYFCWNERKKENGVIEYHPFNHVSCWTPIADNVRNYLYDLKNTRERE